MKFKIGDKVKIKRTGVEATICEVVTSKTFDAERLDYVFGYAYRMSDGESNYSAMESELELIENIKNPINVETNKYQEALAGLIEELPYTSGVIEERIKTLQELIEKETLHSLNYEGDGYDPDGELVYDTAICVCGRNFEFEYEEHYKYCPDCGRKLDWSECENE